MIERFTQEDTYRGDGLNLYACCGNNPVMYYDSSGQNSCGSQSTTAPDKPKSAGEDPMGSSSNQLALPAPGETSVSSRRAAAEQKLAAAARGSRAEGILIGKDGDVPVHQSQRQLVDSIESAGAEFVGNTRNGITLHDEKFDGCNRDKYCYYGASSLFLHAICKMLKRMCIFDSNHLDLINIKEDALSRNTSLSRLIITYLYTRNESVPITELFEAFDKVFEAEYICKILGQLIKRVKGEIWRRPIYYSRNALDNENDIQNVLYKQYKKYKNNEQCKYTEFRICDCGETYINEIVPQFEFYSVRIDEQHPNLYSINKVEDLEEVLQSVFEKIQVCCEKQIEFARKYMEEYNLDRANYLTQYFHPRTHLENPQLHIERVIFSHIEYFNKYRMYLNSKNKPEKYDKFNDVLLKYIGNYLEVYNDYILKICSDRKGVAKKMQDKLKLADEGEKYISIEAY